MRVLRSFSFPYNPNERRLLNIKPHYKYINFPKTLSYTHFYSPNPITQSFFSPFISQTILSFTIYSKKVITPRWNRKKIFCYVKGGKKSVCVLLCTYNIIIYSIILLLQQGTTVLLLELASRVVSDMTR